MEEPEMGFSKRSNVLEIFREALQKPKATQPPLVIMMHVYMMHVSMVHVSMMHVSMMNVSMIQILMMYVSMYPCIHVSMM